MNTRVVSLVFSAVIVSSVPVAAWCPDNWTRDSANPVLSDAIPGTVLFHDGVYKMWYEASGGFYYATSLDGRVWDTSPSDTILTPGPGAWEAKEINSPSVVIVGDTYHMWYSGEPEEGGSQIGYAVSPDGINWTKAGANPVLELGDPGSWDSNQCLHPFVIHEDPLFRMWYNGHDGDKQRILYAVSLNGVLWARATTPALAPGGGGDWDNDTLAMMYVLPFDGAYYMWYTALDHSEELRIGYATSPDGDVWTKRVPNEPVFGPGDPGTWDDSHVAAPVVLATGTELVMWYTGLDSASIELSNFQVGVATACLPVSVSETSSIHISRAVPNPFKSQTAIQYTLPTPARVVLQIQDATGRLVRRLIDGQSIGVGSQRIIWDGRDDSGREVPAGIYFYSLEAGDFLDRSKLVLVR